MRNSVFSDWTLFEKLFLICGLSLALGLNIALRGKIVNLIYTLIIFSSALLLAKGKKIGFLVGLLGLIFYMKISYDAKYYGEIIISLTILIPISVIGYMQWNSHQIKTTVAVGQISVKEVIIMLAAQIVIFPCIYYFLKFFNTDNLTVSSISVALHLIAGYLTIRRSEYAFIGFGLCDIILVFLWVFQVINGDMLALTIMLYFYI